MVLCARWDSHSVPIGPSELQPHTRLIPHYPRIVPGRDNRSVSGTGLRLRTIVHHDLHPPGKHIAHVVDLAAVGACDRLYVSLPPPPWLKDKPSNGNVAQVYDVRFPLIDELSSLVRGL